MAPTIWIRSNCGKNAVESIEIEKNSRIYSYSLIFATVIRNSIVKYAAYGLKGRVTVSKKGWVSGKGRGAVWREIPFRDKRIEPQYLMQLRKLRRIMIKKQKTEKHKEQYGHNN